MIYTKTGDGGKTSLIGGARVSKIDPRVCVLGELDELNAHLGVLKIFLRAKNNNNKKYAILWQIQNDICAICAEIADARPNKDKATRRISKKNVEILEKYIDELEKKLPPIKKFVTPGKNLFEAQAHVTRAVCRRAERAIVALSKKKMLKNPDVIAYTNRLSDLLFVISRKNS